MTIKRRLAVSNVLMIVVPVAITVFIAMCCMTILWFVLMRGTGVGFEDSTDFSNASSGISGLAADALKFSKESDRRTALKALSSFLDRGAMSLVVTADGEEFYSYGERSSPQVDAQLCSAALALGNEGTLCLGTRNLRVSTVEHNGTGYVIYLFNSQRELSYRSLKIAVGVVGGILTLAILLSVFFTDRFLTLFVFRHIEQPLEQLVGGVRQISEGNLDYRLEYTGKDEFLPVCRDFNDMAGRLQESVERSRREDESRKALMAGISHDLRSPLTSIQAYVEGLLDGVAATPEAQRRYLSTIKAKAEELEGMVERVLAYSRSEMEDAERHAVPLRLDEALQRELDALSPDYAQRGLDILARLEPFSAVAVPEELRQLLLNLADNSLKFKTRERATLRLELQNRGESCRLSFTDDGPGVAEAALPRIFDVFYRSDLSRSDRTKGSGLGLSIVEKTVHRMGGSIRAENAPEGGLAIIMEIPRGGADHAENFDH